jgi:hypothetical protein
VLACRKKKARKRESRARERGLERLRERVSASK